MEPNSLHHGVRHAPAAFATRALMRRQRAPKFMTHDAVLIQVQRLHDQSERKEQRDVCGGKERGRRIKIVENDQEEPAQKSKERIPEREANSRIAEAVHGVLVVTP